MTQQAKAIFGLTPKNIELINNKIKEYEAMGIKDSDGKIATGWAIYSHYFWQEVAQELSWEPLTLALWYFRDLNKNQAKWNLKQTQKTC